MTRPTEQRLIEFSKTILRDEEVMNEVMNRVQQDLFKRFLTSSNEERLEISSIMNSGTLFIGQLYKIVNENIEDLNK